VTHSGDSDSTGAIAGNMLGLLDPAAVFAHPWAGAVECADRIAGLVRDHIALEEDPDRAEALSSRYPGT
jgi:ADP-ribosyl-[dinitrogen reductase] hydrolase